MLLRTPPKPSNEPPQVPVFFPIPNPFLRGLDVGLDLGLLPWRQGTQRFVGTMGFKRMTPVQAIAIPLLLKQRDVAVEVRRTCFGRSLRVAGETGRMRAAWVCEGQKKVRLSVIGDWKLRVILFAIFVHHIYRYVLFLFTVLLFVLWMIDQKSDHVLLEGGAMTWPTGICGGKVNQGLGHRWPFTLGGLIHSWLMNRGDTPVVYKSIGMVPGTGFSVPKRISLGSRFGSSTTFLLNSTPEYSQDVRTLRNLLAERNMEGHQPPCLGLLVFQTHPPVYFFHSFTR